MAPKANILLVETPMTETEGVYGFPQIVAAENYVIDHHLGDVISQSFGAAEQTFTNPSQLSSLRSAYINAAQQGVTILASSGDNGSTDDVCDPTSGCANPSNVICCNSNNSIDWPSSDPLVTAVGGTQLHLDAEGNRTRRTASGTTSARPSGSQGSSTPGGQVAGATPPSSHARRSRTGWQGSSAAAAALLTSR